MKRMDTIKKHLEAKGYVVIERDGTLVLSQELQEDSLHYKDGDLEFDYPPTVHQYDCDSLVSDEVDKISGEGWMWECDYSHCFKLYKD